MSELSLTVLVENTVYKQGILAEHGLSLLIECDGVRTLFDTGQGMSLVHNMKALNIDPSSIENLILSHSHYDHTGGVPSFLKRAHHKLKVFIHSAAFDPCFSKRGDRIRSIGLSNKCMGMLKSVKTNLNLIEKPVSISEKVHLTGTIPRSHSCCSDQFYYNSAATEINHINDDLAAYVTTSKGIIVITGCSHAGAISIIEHVKSLTQSTIYAVVGGFHLIHATDEDRSAVAEYLDQEGVELVVPLHCSGFEGQKLFSDKLEKSCKIFGAGETILL